MNDSYGDGWNGNVLTINGEEFTLTAGQQDLRHLEIVLSSVMLI